MSFIIISILLLISFFMFRSMKKGEIDGFWKNFFATITLKVVDHYCKGTPTKVVMLFLRGAFGMYAAVTIGYPTVKAMTYSNSTETFFELLLSWDEVNWIFTLLFLGIAAVVVIAYLICNKYESRCIQRIEGLSGAINETTKETKNDVKQILGILQGKQNTVIQHLLPITIDNINKLKIVTAYTYLQTMKNEVENSYSQDDELKAELLYWMGCCSRYSGETERCKEEYRKAFQLMETAGHDNPNILAGMVFVSCKEESEPEAKSYAERLQKEDKGNSWGWVPSLHFTDDLQTVLRELRGKTESPEMVLATELMIRNRPTYMLPELMKGYQQELLSELTYNNLPLWVLNLSIELNNFVQSWKIMPKGMDMSNDSAKRLFSLTDSYLNCLKKTEIKNLLPDTVYLHALTGYCQDKDEKWVKEMKDATFSVGHKEIFYLSYALMLVESKRTGEALDLLKGYGEDATIGILNYRMHVAMLSGQLEDLDEVFKFAADKQVVIYDHYIGYFASYPRWNFEKVKDAAWKLEFENPLSKKVYQELLKFWEEKDVDIAFLQEHEQAIDMNLRPFVALVYRKYIGIDEAIRLAKSCLPENELDVRTYIYIELLQSDPSKTRELYHFLTSLREKGLDFDDRLIEQEMNLSEKMEDFKVSVATSSILVKRHPDIPAYWEHYLIALSTQDENKEEIVKSIPVVSNLELQYSQVYNIYKVLHIIGKDEEGVAFLYDQTQKKNSQELRDEFFKASLNDSVSEIMCKQDNVVTEGSYVLYESDGKQEYETVRTGGTLECLIGKKPGETAIVKSLSGERKLTVLAIFNKYFRLLKEIGQDIAANKSNSFISINSNSEEFKSKPIDVIRQIAGPTPEQRMQQEINIKNYQSGNLALIAFTSRVNFISKLYDLLFNDFMLISIPDPSVKELFDQIGIAIEKMDLVLDMTSLVMLHELDALFNLDLRNRKLLLPKGVVNQIDYAILYEKKEIPSFFGGKGVNRLEVDNPAEGETPYVTKLRMLKAWAERNCQIEVVEEKLNMNFSNLKTVATSVESESLILANKQGRALITEDWVFCKTMAGMFPAMSVSNLLYLIKHPKYEKVARFMTSTNRVGQDVSAAYICEQYDLMHQQKEHYWNQCLNNIRFNPLLFVSAFDAAVKLSTGIITPAKNMAVQSLLVTVFKSALPETVMANHQVALLKSQNANYRQNLADAIKICYPELSQVL